MTPPPACVPTTCQALGTECGAASDGCGGTLKCGGCGGTGTCNGGVCVACTPDCAGKQCGDDGCGSSCGTCASSEVCQSNRTCSVPSTALFFQDNIQNGSKPWGFTATTCEHPIAAEVACSDANGANVTRVPDPLGGRGFALRHFARVGDTGGSEGGARSQIGLWFNDNPEWQAAATSGDKIYIAQELYIPTEMVGTGNYPWLDIMGIQVTNNSGDNRWHTNPGLHIASDWYEAPGRMYLSIDWGSQSGQNPDVMTSIPLPVGEWFDLEFSWQWTAAFDSTMEVWINGTLAATLKGVRTHTSGQTKVELYGNLYGSPNGGNWPQSDDHVPTQHTSVEVEDYRWPVTSFF